MAFSAYIWSCRNQSYSHIRMAQHSYLTCEEPILSSWQNGSALTYDHGRNQSSHHVRMAHGLITSLWREPWSREHQASPWSTQTSLWLMALSTHQLLFVRRNMLELHCSSLHHIPDIVIFDLDMLRLVMEQWVLWKLHTALVVAIYTSNIQLKIK